jgi:hypothetical protein
MLSKRRSAVELLVVAGICLAAAGACTEQTAPTATAVAATTALPAMAGSNSDKVKVKTFQLSAYTLRIDGPAITAQVSIANSGSPIQSGASLRAEIAQGAATRQSASLPTQCNPAANPGFLPPNNCDMTFSATASNSAPGSGTLVPGPATFTLHVVQTTAGVETELANKSILVNLVTSPSITTLTLAPTTLTIDGPAATYTATLQNPAGSLQGVLLQGLIVQGEARHAAGGVLVACGSSAGVFPPGPCTMTFSASASSSGGTGTLVQGAATFELDLIQNSGGVATTLDVGTVAITLAKPTITSLVLTSPALALNGPSMDYTAELKNLGSPVSSVLLQGELVQNQGGATVTVAAGGTLVDCGAGLGVLPTTNPGTCSVAFVATASTTAAGNGTLTYGPAQFVLHLYKAPAGGPVTEFDRKTIAVTIIASARITSLTPSSSYVVLGASSTPYSATLENLGPSLSDVLIQGWIIQGSARRAAGGTQVFCEAGDGVLPTGTCTVPSDISASNSGVGSGTLATGPATFELDLQDFAGGTLLDKRFIPITLVANTPSIVSISLASTTPLVIGGARANFTAVVYNPTGASLSGVSVQGWIDQGSTFRAAGGTDLTCAGTNGMMPRGSCVVSFTLGASNASSGSGTLVSGGATFRLELKQGATLLDTKSAGIALTSSVAAP